ncbi:MAG: SDR family oxidoreductase [Promethearchaeota archaeon]|nr:MAG: SDR family oxidoreductase [Candidatus Lokiarchaeota archaeon]
MKIPFVIDVNGKVIVVTGGGGVLCGHFSEALAECGGSIAILDINKDAAEEIANKIREKNGIAMAVETDVLNKQSLINAKKIIVEKWGKINILINGAGGNNPKATTSQEYLTKHELKNQDEMVKNFFELEQEGVEFVFDLNFIGTFLSSQVFAKEMIDQENPTIINISSMNALRPLTKIPAYSAAKAAVSNFTQWLSVYMAKIGIRVNAIAPGFFLTEQNRSLLINENGKFTDRAKTIIDHTPLGRFGEPEDLIGTLFWLLDDKASRFVTGIVVPVDGGFSAFSGV